MSYSKRQLEDLESLQSHRGYAVLLLERERVAKQTLVKNSQAKNRDLVSKETIIHESAIEQIRENNGFLAGIDSMIKLVETAREKRLKQ